MLWSLDGGAGDQQLVAQVASMCSRGLSSSGAGPLELGGDSDVPLKRLVER